MNPEVLLAGFVGAVLVFLLQFVWRLWQDDRERRALLRLLRAEIEHNVEVTNTIGERTWDLLSSPDLHSIRSVTWRDVQVRAALLLPRDLIDALNDYYSPLQRVLTLLTFHNR